MALAGYRMSVALHKIPGTLCGRKGVRAYFPGLVFPGRYGIFGCAGLLGMLLVSGCLASRTLNHVVMEYDRSVSEGVVEQLLLNIARSVHREPIHFTAVSNIAATFDYRFNAGATPPLGGVTGGFSLAPIFGAAIAENPTITIVPIEGEEFTQRLLTPFEEHRLILLLRQGYDIDMMLRLMAQELRVKEDGVEVAYRNNPAMREEYEIFRRAVLHISTLQDHNQLFAEPLIIERHLPLPVESLSLEQVMSTGPDHQVLHDPSTGEYSLGERVSGRILITNYDPDILSPAERIRLNEEAARSPVNDVWVDIRPGFPGGAYPIHGKFRLRSFHAMINFLGRSLDDQPEFDVSPAPVSGPNVENPPQTLTIRRSSTKPADVKHLIAYRGNYFYVDPEGPYGRWNAQGFDLLYQLFQMTVSEIPRAGIPGLTIAK